MSAIMVWSFSAADVVLGSFMEVWRALMRGVAACWDAMLTTTDACWCLYTGKNALRFTPHFEVSPLEVDMIAEVSHHAMLTANTGVWRSVHRFVISLRNTSTSETSACPVGK